MAANPGNATTTLNTITLPEFTDLVRREWIMTKDYKERSARQLYIVEQVGAGQGSSKRYKEVDVETYADVKGEGANAAKSLVGNGYEVDMTARTFAKEIEITLEMRNDNRYAEVGSYITSLSEFCPNRQDLDLTHRLTFSNATSYTDKNGYTVDTTVGDSYALLYATHTLAFSSTQYNNIVTGNPAFSQGAYEAALLIAATQIYSNFGEWRVLNFNTIITGEDPGTVREVKQLLNSMADIDGAHAGIINVYKDGMKHIILPYLPTTATGAYDSTKRRWWFIAAIGLGVKGWQAYLGEWISPQLKTPSSGNNGEDIHNLNWTYLTYCRYGIAVVSPKGLVGSNPTS